MATTRISDVVVPAVYTDYTSVDNPETTALYQSGVVVRNALMDSRAEGPSDITTLPFWNDLDPTVAPNISDDDPSHVATPLKTGAGSMRVRNGHYNQHWSDADLVSELIGESPMQHIKNKTGTYWMRQWQRKLIAQAKGIMADNIANDASDMVVALADKFNRTAFIQAIFTLGDQFGKIRNMAIHSAVYQQMLINDDIEFIPDSEGNLTIPAYMGVPLTVDDSMPQTALTGSTGTIKYTSMLFGAGAWGYGVGSPEVPVEVTREALQGNGGGVEILSERKTWLLHPLGFDFTSASVAGQNPTDAEWATAANWDRKYPRKTIPLAFLTSFLTTPT